MKSKYGSITFMTRNASNAFTQDMRRPSKDKIKEMAKEGYEPITGSKAMQIAEDIKNKRESAKEKERRDYFEKAHKDIMSGRSFVKENIAEARGKKNVAI